MGSCCDKDNANSDKDYTLRNGEKVDLEFYNKPENLEKIQKIQATIRGKIHVVQSLS